MSKPPLTYYGGKQLLLKYILPLIPPHEHYIEPFFGGGAVFWAKKPSKHETINDANSILITFYEQLKNNFDELNDLIDSSLYAEDLHKTAKDVYKNKDNFSRVKQAWAVWFLAHSSISCNLNAAFLIAKNHTNGNMGKLFSGRKKRMSKEFAGRLENVQILNRDACKVIKNLDTKHCFFYIDPPYIDSAQGHYKGYTKENYQELLDTLAGIEGNFMLSSFPNNILQEYSDRYKWVYKEITQNSPASALTGHLKNKTEVLAMNYNPYKNELF